MTDVSVVVIVYNDADRLPAAVRSVLDQSHRDVEAVIVDDASTDATAAVADGLAAAEPARVRVIHRTANSGGCGQPRNDGIAEAHGTYLMFLDSDDTLDRHACRNLVAAAEENEAELVSGCCWRVFPDKGEERAWYRGVYRERGVYASVRERPELLYDTLSTNKLYRRDFLDREGLRFVERLHYEDLLFSTQAYLAARKIAIIPHRVYNWMIYENRRSITNQRAELRNFSDRLEIFRRIDAVYARYEAGDLKLSKDVKFLNHDLLLYVRGLRSRDRAYREAFLSLAREYLATIDPRAYGEAHEIQAIIGFMVARGDYEGAISGADFAGKGKTGRPRLTASLVERDGRIYWSADHLDTEEGRRVLDVTELGIHSLPLKSLNPGGRVTGMERAGRVLRLTGDVVNPLNRIRADAPISARLEFRDRSRTGRFFAVPAEVTPAAGRLRWSAEVVPGRDVRPLGFVDQSWGLRLRLRTGGEELFIRLFADDPMDLSVPVRPRLTRLAGDHFEAYVPESGEMAFRLVAHGRVGRATLAALRRLTATGRGRRWWTALLRAERRWRGVFTRRTTKLAVYNRLLVRLPIRRDAIVFESHLGKQYSDSPKYIYEELRRSGAKYTAIWSYAKNPDGFPEGAKLVRRGSWPYYLALARAGHWVDNQGFPPDAVKRPQTTYIQTWHGSAYKRMGFDQPQVKRSTKSRRARFQRTVDRYDAFLIRSEHDARTLAKGLGVRAELIRSGYPRNDALVNGADTAKLSARLQLDGRRVVLYAPTFRAGPNGKAGKRFEMPFDLEEFAAELGETHILLVRPHYLNSAVVPPSLRGVVRDVTAVHDVTSLLLLADALVTDYSSLMFDYALLDRPMVFFAPDLEDYARTRGTYFDLRQEAPGPVVTEPDELFGTLADLDGLAAAYAKQRRGFAERYGEYDRGTAAKQIVDRFFTGERDA
ncbi:bifunctional glycosyltransferase family 2 protein/CDP-glycerol:glycerophosphate glycerophosphotransferase [Actinomadura sp. DC4]|uniref:bifunctional glycosyltransferase/CDP-glycerol:glycerophosphate glycerophosphotransferase n=1 Tax=Actinomadura sp. DC4 TaxID=3055069 RepID=UPI0025B03F8B|nr:bifunctional glycosyltransferase family 2 protein/CDP-glycerol:glycerophosphate glycerophosphotransferase [Actinomadura sp. DC4]MDN3352458.1 bifunctional glycosyltransferase family 2 protein/CDP-glycerol:glycerophosphate glycerophosphotransferase [Actinomadura sp. DC4]